MKKYKVFRSVTFQEEIAKYDKLVQDRIDKIEDKLMYNCEYGNPLGTKGFRESRFENYRIYYLIYEDLQAIYIVAISGKKDQQKIINTIKLFLEFFREEIEKLVKENNSQDKES
jgi:mRNA-degrading endonuclease RelE of RelBE toxin-antitoxin system